MRIDQQSDFLSSLLQDVRQGRLLPAGFQRPYAWSQAHVIALCESILEGYPIGGFLTWSPERSVDPSKLGRTRLGPILPTEGDARAGLLLDGQNRLASLAWMMQAPGSVPPPDLQGVERETWGGQDRVGLDLARRCLRFMPADEIESGFTLPAWVLFRNVETNREVRGRWEGAWRGVSTADREAGVDWMDRCIDAFSDARVVVTLLENASVIQAKKAFLHICRSGVPMSESDFDAATAWMNAAASAIPASHSPASGVSFVSNKVRP